MRKRATAIITEGDSVLLIYRHNPRGTYYVFPGGGVKPGETPIEGVKRECREELGIEVEVGDLVLEYQEESVNHHVYAYLCKRINPNERVTWKEKRKQTADNHYRVDWVERKFLKQLEVLPHKLRDMLADGVV